MPIPRSVRPLALAGAVILAMAGCGGDDDDDVSAESPAGTEESSDGHAGHGDDETEAPPAGEVSDVEARTVEVEMRDELVYNPATLTVQGGEKIRFVFKNTGKLPHDALIGDAHIQEEHASGGGHDDHHGGEKPPFVTVEPGGTEELTYEFTTPGEIIIGCHQVGHWAGGMKLPITVS